MQDMPALGDILAKSASAYRVISAQDKRAENGLMRCRRSILRRHVEGGHQRSEVVPFYGIPLLSAMGGPGDEGEDAGSVYLEVAAEETPLARYRPGIGPPQLR